MTDPKYTKPLKFSWLMTRFVSVPLYFEAITSDEKMKDAFVRMRLSQVDEKELNELLSSVLPGIEQEVLEEARIIHTKEVQSSLRREMKDLFPILLNQALIVCCAILDSFLTDCMKSMMPLAILFLEKESDIGRLTAILDSGGSGDEYDEILERKIMDQFDLRSGIRGKIDFLKRAGVDCDSAITFKHKGRPKSVRYSLDEAYAFLYAAYDKRHAVAHKGQLPLTTYADLEEISEFFSGANDEHRAHSERSLLFTDGFRHDCPRRGKHKCIRYVRIESRAAFLRGIRSRIDPGGGKVR